MLVKCPKCATGYNVPDEKLGNKPTKMRCARCKTIFAISKRGNNVPTGYDEFTGGHEALPSEFAFLKKSEKKPDQRPIPSTETEPSEAKTSEAQSSEDTPSKTNVAQKKEQEAPNLRTHTALTKEDLPEDTEIPAPSETQHSSPTAPKSPPPPPHSDQKSDAQTHSQASAVDDEAAPSGIYDIYGTQSAWEIKAPLELDSYAVQKKTRGQTLGKAIAIAIALIAFFFVFVAFRNGWNLSFANLGHQVAFAFSNNVMEPRPHEVESIEVIVEKSRVLKRKRGSSLLVVSGIIFNNASTRRSNIILRGQIRNPTGEVVNELRLPCGIVLEDKQLKKVKEGKILSLYNEKSGLHNCTMLAESNKSFQLVFEKVPPSFNLSFGVDVVAISARIGREV